MRSTAAAAASGGTSNGAATGGAIAAPAVAPVGTADPGPTSVATPSASDPAPDPAAVSDPEPATPDPAAPATPATDGLTQDNGISTGGPTEVDNVPGTASSSGKGTGVGTTGTAQVWSVRYSLLLWVLALLVSCMARQRAGLSLRPEP